MTFSFSPGFSPVRLLMFLLLSFSSVYAQDTEKNDEPTDVRPTIVLASGSQMLVDDVFERDGGYWYRVGNISTFLDRARVLRVEFPKSENEAAAPVEKNPGKWRLAEAGKVKTFFFTKFNKPLPVSAFGQSDLHTRWGLDHRNSMDVNLHPDSVEGRALIAYLRAEAIPFLVFRAPIPGVATGPHIHVGYRSSRSYRRSSRLAETCQTNRQSPLLWLQCNRPIIRSTTHGPLPLPSSGYGAGANKNQDSNN